MNRLTTWRFSSPSQNWEKPVAPANLGQYAKRSIKTSSPVSHSFGRGYGLVAAKLLTPLQSTNDFNFSKRNFAIGKSKAKAEQAIEEENLKPKNIKISSEKESLDDITKDLVQLTEKEIQTILDDDANSIQTERGKTWLEQSKYVLSPVPDQKDSLMLTKKTGNASVTVLFKKEYEEVDEEEGNEANEDQYEEGAETNEQEVAQDEDNEGQEGWIRSGDELPDREDLPQKHSMEIDIRIQDKDGKQKGKLHLYGFAGLDDRLYINEMLCESGPEVAANPNEKKSYIVFDDLSDPMQDRIYDYLDELGVDDRMAHFVKTTVAREKKENDIAFLNNFKEILKSKKKKNKHICNNLFCEEEYIVEPSNIWNMKEHDSFC